MLSSVRAPDASCSGTVRSVRPTLSAPGDRHDLLARLGGFGRLDVASGTSGVECPVLDPVVSTSYSVQSCDVFVSTSYSVESCDVSVPSSVPDDVGAPNVHSPQCTNTIPNTLHSSDHRPARACISQPTVKCEHYDSIVHVDVPYIRVSTLR